MSDGERLAFVVVDKSCFEKLVPLIIFTYMAFIDTTYKQLLITIPPRVPVSSSCHGRWSAEFERLLKHGAVVFTVPM